MPVRGRLQSGVWALLRRAPAGSRVAMRLLDAWCQATLLPFRRRRKRGVVQEDTSVTESAARYNAAAEKYYAHFNDPAFLLNKPFSEPASLPKHLIDAGILIRALRVTPGDTVLELGAGSCWLSHLLNRYGCRTISVDVSTTALELGRQLFDRDHHTNWSLEPRFLTYDGFHLPVGDGSCDGVVVSDAFHHVPNQREVLREIYRVLKPHGVLAMSEPGQNHASTERSVQDMQEWGVLENELALEDVAARARDCGFARVSVVVASPFVDAEVDAADLGAFMGGKGFASYWKSFCSALEQHHYIVCAKQVTAATTRHPSLLSAAIDVVSPPPAYRVNSTATIELRVTNTGDTVWLGGDAPRSGWTRLGAHLCDGDGTRLLDFDWARYSLPCEVTPGQSVMVTAALPAINGPGRYVVVFDVVIEGMSWFGDLGSRTARVDVTVTDAA